jgi:hypothetical protein
VRDRGRIMGDASLTVTGHKRPMKPGLPMGQAKAKAAEIEVKVGELPDEK